MGSIYKVESAIATLIESIDGEEDYNFDWGSSNIIDESKIDKYPNVMTKLYDVSSLDDTSGFNGEYALIITEEITIRNKLNSEEVQPVVAIRKEQSDALDDLLMLFGNNYSLCVNDTPNCSFINFDSIVERKVHDSGDIFRASDLVTRWNIRVNIDRLNLTLQ